MTGIVARVLGAVNLACESRDARAGYERRKGAVLRSCVCDRRRHNRIDIV